MRSTSIKESNLHSYIRWCEISEGFKFNIEMLEQSRGTGMFYVALGCLVLMAPSTLGKSA